MTLFFLTFIFFDQVFIFFSTLLWFVMLLLYWLWMGNFFFLSIIVCVRLSYQSSFCLTQLLHFLYCLNNIKAFIYLYILPTYVTKWQATAKYEIDTRESRKSQLLLLFINLNIKSKTTSHKRKNMKHKIYTLNWSNNYYVFFSSRKLCRINEMQMNMVYIYLLLMTQWLIK